MNPKDFKLYHIFESGLTIAPEDMQSGICESLGYGQYDSTVTHGAFNIKMSLDLYKPTEVKEEMQIFGGVKTCVEDIEATIGDLKVCSVFSAQRTATHKTHLGKSLIFLHLLSRDCNYA